MKSNGVVIAIILITVSGIMGYSFGSHNIDSQSSESKNIQVSDEIKGVREGGYKYINPLLECETGNFANNRKYIPFEKDAIDILKKEVQDKNPDIKFSLYFRNLNNGPWFGINEDEQFFPASLIKLPILIMYYKWVEINPSILQSTVKIEELAKADQVYKPEKTLEKDKSYTVKELLDYLITYSENNAVNPLLSILPKDIQIDVFQDLGVPIPTKELYQITTKDYASFFRILYNASYLSKTYSEDALEILTHTTFDDGIRGGIPDNIKVAHKFGEREVIDENNKAIHQLHDCGIVYYPGYPYLICVMTKGEDVPMEKLASIIKKSSSIIYDQISHRYPYSLKTNQ